MRNTSGPANRIIKGVQRLVSALEAESYSEASSVPFNSLFPISITSLTKERETGIEPATSGLGSLHSTAELLPQGFENTALLALTSMSARNLGCA